MEKPRIAVITGAGSGIGKATAQTFLGEGYNVVMAGRRPDKLAEAIREFGVAPGRALAVPTDTTDEKSVANLFAKAVEAFGRVDVLFNNAGIASKGVPIEDIPLERWKAAIDANLTGSFLCAREAVRTMKRQSPRGGRIINNGSVSVHTPRPNSTPYTASKMGVSGLTKCLALDCRKYDIFCGQIDIGNANSDMTAQQAEGVMQADGSLAIEPRMDVREVARAVVFMAGQPPDANILHLTVMASKMPLVGRG